MCGQLPVSSLLLLRALFRSAYAIASRSRLHVRNNICFPPPLRLPILSIIDHLISKGSFLSLRLHTYFDNLVLFRCFSCLKEDLWTVNLCLKELPLEPIYSLVSRLEETTALYMMFSCLQLSPPNGQLSFLRQLQKVTSVFTVIQLLDKFLDIYFQKYI